MTRYFWLPVIVWALIGLVVPIQGTAAFGWYLITSFGGLVCWMSSFAIADLAVEGGVLGSTRPREVPVWRKSWCRLSRIDFAAFRMPFGIGMILYAVGVAYLRS